MMLLYFKKHTPSIMSAIRIVAGFLMFRPKNKYAKKAMLVPIGTEREKKVILQQNTVTKL